MLLKPCLSHEDWPLHVAAKVETQPLKKRERNSQAGPHPFSCFHLLECSIVLLGDVGFQAGLSHQGCGVLCVCQHVIGHCQ